MTDGDHLGGAMASNSRGDLAETLERLERCRSSERAVKWRSFLWSETGPVKIESQSASELTLMMGLLTPDQIAAIDYANQQLKQQRVFVGRLPNGAYQYGSSQLIVSAAGITMTNAWLSSGDTVVTDYVNDGEKEMYEYQKYRKIVKYHIPSNGDDHMKNFNDKGIIERKLCSSVHLVCIPPFLYSNISNLVHSVISI